MLIFQPDSKNMNFLYFIRFKENFIFNPSVSSGGKSIVILKLVVVVSRGRVAMVVSVPLGRPQDLALPLEAGHRNPTNSLKATYLDANDGKIEKSTSKGKIGSYFKWER